MGVLPLQFLEGQTAQTLKLTGKESYQVTGISKALSGGTLATVRAVDDAGAEKRFDVQVRVDTPQEAEYYRNGGILPYVLRQLAATPVTA
jgi:aconitate hydratase